MSMFSGPMSIGGLGGIGSASGLGLNLLVGGGSGATFGGANAGHR